MRFGRYMTQVRSAASFGFISRGEGLQTTRDFTIGLRLMAADPVNGFGRRPPLGRILVERGVLTEAQLNAALDEQRRTGERLGAVLLRRGYTSGPTIGLGLATQQGETLKTEYGFAVPARSTRSATEGEA